MRRPTEEGDFSYNHIFLNDEKKDESPIDRERNTDSREQRGSYRSGGPS